jgi:hypothetical protein
MESQSQLPDTPCALPELTEQLKTCIIRRLAGRQQPSAAELLAESEREFGWFVRHVFAQIIRELSEDKNLPGYSREYLRNTLCDEEIQDALRSGMKITEQEHSTIDELFRRSILYRHSPKFAEAIEFAARFRDYAPYNNMLVKVQNPSCTYYATAKDWDKRFKRHLKEDAKPLLILAPMHPVMLVYDIDQTDGPPLPANFQEFSTVHGSFDQAVLDRTLENAHRMRIKVQRKPLAQLHAGFATTRIYDDQFKMRIVVHDQLDAKATYSVLCHELAHILLGHLGADEDHWWPVRSNLDHSAVEIEAESVAYVVAVRNGLTTGAPAYLARYVESPAIPQSVSIELICKVAGKLDEWGKHLQPIRKTKEETATSKRTPQSSGYHMKEARIGMTRATNKKSVFVR